LFERRGRRVGRQRHLVVETIVLSPLKVEESFVVFQPIPHTVTL
jgi:hypothetical protein